MFYIPLPFTGIEGFDYIEIAEAINKLKPDIIWVSLGAPKQEFFMSKIFPYLNKGLLFGIGAAFNFYTGMLGMPTVKIGALRFIWLDRFIKEPRKLYSRLINYLFILPGLYLEEKKKYNALMRMQR